MFQVLSLSQEQLCICTAAVVGKCLELDHITTWAELRGNRYPYLEFKVTRPGHSLLALACSISYTLRYAVPKTFAGEHPFCLEIGHRKCFQKISWMDPKVAEGSVPVWIQDGHIESSEKRYLCAYGNGLEIFPQSDGVHYVVQVSFPVLAQIGQSISGLCDGALGKEAFPEGLDRPRIGYRESHVLKKS